MLDSLVRRIRAGWCREMSYTPEAWTPERPAIGQCAVTALLLHDETGARILKTHDGAGGSHYYNALGGTRLDLTAEQFDTPPRYEDIAVDPAHLRTNGATSAWNGLLRRRAFQGIDDCSEASSS